MPIEPWFPLAVYYADVEDAAAKKEFLVSTILELEKNSGVFLGKKTGHSFPALKRSSAGMGDFNKQ